MVEDENSIINNHKLDTVLQTLKPIEQKRNYMTNNNKNKKNDNNGSTIKKRPLVKKPTSTTTTATSINTNNRLKSTVPVTPPFIRYVFVLCMDFIP